MKTICHKNDIGGVALTYIIEDISVEEFLNKYLQEVNEYIEIDEHFPVNLDVLFRDAWVLENSNLQIDISKAKNVWLEKYRIARKPLLAKLDIDFIKAIENNNLQLQKEIAEKKQALRDVTETELPDTIEEIKLVWPKILGKNPFV